MSLANRLWRAPRIHGELLKLGIEVAQSTVAKYMASSGEDGRRPGRPYLQNHAPDYTIRDRDGSYGQAVTRRLAAMGIPNHPIARGHPGRTGMRRD
jgi:hypothetical protein